jgi:hypothetical protein
VTWFETETQLQERHLFRMAVQHYQDRFVGSLYSLIWFEGDVSNEVRKLLLQVSHSLRYNCVPTSDGIIKEIRPVSATLVSLL